MTNILPEGYTPLKSPGNFSTMIGPASQKRDDDGRLTFGIMIDDRHLNARGVVHGGMLMSFMDQLLGRTVHDELESGATATVQLDNQFLAGVRKGDWLQGKGKIERATRSLVFVTGRLWVGDRTVLVTSGVWKILGA